MITQFQFKLFSNDPKFRNVPANNRHALEIALQKVYAGQRQLHRKLVIMDSIAKKSNPHLSKPNLEIDFIESRLHAFEMMLAEDIEKLCDDVEHITEGYNSRIRIKSEINQKLKGITLKMEAVDKEIGERDEEQLQIIEATVKEIQNLFEENKRIKSENEEIAARIEKRKQTLLGRRSNMNMNISTSAKLQKKEKEKGKAEN